MAGRRSGDGLGRESSRSRGGARPSGYRRQRGNSAGGGISQKRLVVIIVLLLISALLIKRAAGPAPAPHRLLAPNGLRP